MLCSLNEDEMLMPHSKCHLCLVCLCAQVIVATLTRLQAATLLKWPLRRAISVKCQMSPPSSLLFSTSHCGFPSPFLSSLRSPFSSSLPFAFILYNCRDTFRVSNCISRFSYFCCLCTRNKAQICFCILDITAPLHITERSKMCLSWLVGWVAADGLACPRSIFRSPMHGQTFVRKK